MSEADRIVELESRIALLEDGLRELGDEHAAQQRTIDLLQRKCDYLRELIESGSIGESPAAGDDLPPHY